MEGRVVPETFDGDSLPWRRQSVNDAANPLHLEQKLVRDGQAVRYKVAWVGGANVLLEPGEASRRRWLQLMVPLASRACR